LQVELSALEHCLNRADRSGDRAWAAALEARKREELNFHDRRQFELTSREVGDGETMSHRVPVGSGVPLCPARAAREGGVLSSLASWLRARCLYATAASSKAHVGAWLAREAPGSVFLDYACGEGLRVVEAARSGARLAVGLDLSPVAIEKGRQRARDEGLAGRARFLQADAEATGLPDGCIERALCCSVLHHLELDRALVELRRLLAPRGRILVLEALGHNPLLRLYRRLTPGARTAWEQSHLLRTAELKLAARYFEVEQVRFWHIASPAAVLARPLLPALEALDSLLTRLPLVQLAAWVVTFELCRPGDGAGSSR
jgi:ubiquinone/menaquinone biosynthesis C-methylase UbiE